LFSACPLRCEPSAPAWCQVTVAAVLRWRLQHQFALFALSQLEHVHALFVQVVHAPESACHICYICSCVVRRPIGRPHMCSVRFDTRWRGVTVLQSAVEHSVEVYMRSTFRRCRQGKHDKDLGHTDTCLVIRTCWNILECVITGAQTQHADTRLLFVRAS
jgi:hypothetical protein